MEQLTSKRIGSHRLCSFSRQKGMSLIPALITIGIFSILATQVIIPNQNRNLREADINAVASSADKLIQASYAFRSRNNSWPKGFVTSSSPTVVTANEILDSAYLPVFNNHTPWGGEWAIKNPTGNMYFETDTKNIDIARALVQKIGSYAQIVGTVVQVYPVKGASPTLEIEDLTINNDLDVGNDFTVDNNITARGNIILTGQIRASDGTTVLFDASSPPTSSSVQTDHDHSSKRYKQNIQPLDIPIRSIYQLNPVSFDYKDPFKQHKTPNAANKEIGLIAEQVLPLAPEITLVEDNKVMGIDYPKLSILLLKAVQELKAGVTGLQRSNQQLQQQINNLRTPSPLHKSNQIKDIEEIEEKQRG